VIEYGMVCQSLVEVATDWMDGGLPPDERVEVELHIATCAGCIAYIEQLRVTRDMLGALEAEAPAPDVRTTLLDLFRHNRPDDPTQAR
jgi:anti-sigma factor RsiW